MHAGNLNLFGVIVCGSAYICLGVTEVVSVCQLQPAIYCLPGGITSLISFFGVIAMALLFRVHFIALASALGVRRVCAVFLFLCSLVYCVYFGYPPQQCMGSCVGALAKYFRPGI